MRSPAAAFDLRAALTEELRLAIEALDQIETSSKAVHRCRVRVKRARALARVGRSCAPGLSAVFIDSTRSLMHGLAASRDLAALSEAALSTARKSDKRSARALKTVACAIDDIATLQPALNLETAQTGLRDVLALAQVWPEASQAQIKRGARRIERRAKRARRRGVAAIDPMRRDEWRRSEKERHFATLILGKAWPGRRRRKTAEKIGVALDAERDALLLMERLVAEPELAGDRRDLRRALKALNRSRVKLALRADTLAQRMRSVSN